ncbi:hypothetical protein Bca101_058685 [Brassica carinata]
MSNNASTEATNVLVLGIQQGETKLHVLLLEEVISFSVNELRHLLPKEDMREYVGLAITGGSGGGGGGGRNGQRSFIKNKNLEWLKPRSMAMKPNGKFIVSSDYDEKVMFFRDVSLGHHEAQLRFRLIHFWEARNPLMKTLIGLEMLLIDEQGIVIQGFISPSRIEKYLPEMKRGSVYKLNNFYGSRNKSVFRVADHTATVSFPWNSDLSVLQDSPTPFDEDSFRFHSYEEFQANCDLKGDLYDIVGHMKLINGQSLTEPPVLDEVEIAKARHLLVHVQSHDGPVMKLYLWDQTARDFCKKFKTYENTPTVLLVTTVNTKSLGGTFALTSMSSSRVFMDYDVQPTIDYFGWLGSNPEIAEQVNAEVVTKRETLTIAEIFSYIKQESAKDAFFECTATIDDVVHGFAWYRAKISVYDNSDQAVFVLLGDAGLELTGKAASELVRSYFEISIIEDVEVCFHCRNKIEYKKTIVMILCFVYGLIPLNILLMETKELTMRCLVPEALISTIGQRHKFCVKVTEHNLSGKTRSLTVTKILPLDTPPATELSEGNNTTAASVETFETGNDVCEASKSRVDSGEGSKRTCDSAEIERAKRPKSGN